MKFSAGILLWLAVCLLSSFIAEVWSLYRKADNLTYTRDQLLSLRHSIKPEDSGLELLIKYPQLENIASRKGNKIKRIQRWSERKTKEVRQQTSSTGNNFFLCSLFEQQDG